MNKKYSCIAQIFAGLLFLMAEAQACIPVPHAALDPDRLQSAYDMADIVFIGRLEKFEEHPVNVTPPETLAILNVEKHLKNSKSATYHLPAKTGELDCGTAKPDTLWIYFHIPATQPPAELVKTPEIISNPSDEEYKKLLMRHNELQKYQELHRFHLLRDETGKFFPEDAKLIKEKFGYDIAPESAK